MYDFIFNIPTKVLFGKDQHKNLPEEIKKYGSKVLLVYGRNSIKKIGLYDDIIKLWDEYQQKLTRRWVTESVGIERDNIVE